MIGLEWVRFVEMRAIAMRRVSFYTISRVLAEIADKYAKAGHEMDDKARRILYETVQEF